MVHFYAHLCLFEMQTTSGNNFADNCVLLTVYARHEKKPLWQLVADFTPEEFVRSVAFRYITDAISPAEALELLKSKQVGKAERIARMKKEGYPSYTTSAGWFGYPDEKVARLTK